VLAVPAEYPMIGRGPSNVTKMLRLRSSPGSEKLHAVIDALNVKTGPEARCQEFQAFSRETDVDPNPG
jgi:hypothetical protein